MKLTNLEKIWLSGNPLRCDCQMTWMIGWLSKSKDIIDDYQDIKCYSGMLEGLPIYVLNEVLMGCYPHILTKQQKIAIGIAAGISSLVIIALVILVIRKSRDIKFFFYYYCIWCRSIGLPNDDKNEHLDSLLYDAFLCYRYENASMIILVCFFSNL